jgi:sarcosine oxidase subunit beta
VKQRSVDIAIVGGGIMGASLAWHLAQAGAGRVALFERSVIGAGASGRTGALLRRHYSNRPEATLAHRSWQTFAYWPEVIGGMPVHCPTGLIVTVQTTDDYLDNVDRLRRNVALQNEVGIPSQVVSRAELQELQPFACWDDVAFAAYEPDSGYVDAVAATQGMARAAIAAGAEINEASPVREVLVAGDRVRGLRLEHEVFAADVVVIAAGPWTPQLIRPIGVEVPIEALRVQIAILQRPLAGVSRYRVRHLCSTLGTRPHHDRRGGRGSTRSGRPRCL